jgi:hypothetical protein
MRQITDHCCNPVNDKLTLTAIDGGPGGAPNEYEIAVPQGVRTRLSFQNGPINEVGINGINNEVLLAVVIDRLRCYQAGPFRCSENQAALMHATEALAQLHSRTAERIKRGVEGYTKT